MLGRSAVDQPEPVYDLTVADCPEFFANGVLVHNCVWALTELHPELEAGVSSEAAYTDDRLHGDR